MCVFTYLFSEEYPVHEYFMLCSDNKKILKSLSVSYKFGGIGADTEAKSIELLQFIRFVFIYLLQ